MKINDAYVKGISIITIENEKKRAKKEVDFLKKELEKERPELLFVWEESLKVYNLIISRYPHIFNNRDFGERVLQNVRYLNEGFPLTPIEDNDEWLLVRVEDGVKMRKKGVIKKYMNDRLGCLFKDVYEDGHAEFHDNNRVTAVNYITESEYIFGLANLIYDEMYPIKMPYDYEKEWGAKVYIHDFVSDPEDKESNFDTIAVLFAKEPGGKIVSINRYFRVPKDDEEPTYGNWVEIKFSEFADRVRRANSNLTIEDLDYSYLLDKEEDDQNEVD